MDLNGGHAREDLEAVLKAPSRQGIGLAIGLLAAVTLYGSGQALQQSYGPALFCSPLVIGAIVGLFSPRRPVRAAIATLLLAMAVAIVTFREGIVCSLFSLPLVMPEAIIGAICGATIRRHVRGRRARRALGVVLWATAIAWQAIEGAVDDPAHHPLHEARAAIRIAAPPARVFAALVGRDLEVAPDWPWFLRIGLPMPIRMRVDDGGLGANVTATFSQGVATGHVTESVPGRALAYTIDRYAITDLPFHITRLGRGPSYGLRAERVDDWLTLVTTRYDLQPDGDGETRLERTVVWRRHLGPAFYFAWLQQTVMARGQQRLLELIRRTVTAPGADPASVLAGRNPPPRDL